jgi:hypothetical protein
VKTMIIAEDRNHGAELAGQVLLVEIAGRVSVQNGDPSATDLDAGDIALLDERIDLATARNWCALLCAEFPLLPQLIVAEQSALVAIDDRWCVDDVVMPELPREGQSHQWLRHRPRICGMPMSGVMGCPRGHRAGTATASVL